MRTARAWKPRTAGVALALAAVALLFAACGNGSASPGVASGGSTTTSTSPSSAAAGNSGSPPSVIEAALKFVSSMRTHGVPNMPDPIPGGGYSRSALNAANPNSPQFMSAEKPCRSYAVAAGFGHTPAEIAKHVAQETAEDACIRKHGVPDMPDPNSQGEQSFPQGISPSTTQFQKAEKACAYLNP
ncbi:MAG: hypothetical protein WCF24_05780 [Acidimicrobiales bacterium]